MCQRRMCQRISLVLGMSYLGVFTCALTAAMFTLSGCGGDEAGGGADDAAASDDAGSSGAAGNGGSPKAASNGAYVDEQGRKWLGKDFPYDVWYNDPLAVARQQGRVAQPSTADAGTKPTNAGQTPTEPMPANADGAIDWKDVIAASVLDGEMKKIANRFRAKLQTVATYNTSYLELPPYVATMAAFSGIAVRHPDAIRWKKNARQIRDLSASMLTKKLQRGPKSYKQVNEPYLAISDILSGSPPGGLPEPNADDSLAEYADIGFLMKRIEIGAKWMQVNVGTEAALKDNADNIKHEVAVLAALLTATTTEGYGYVDDDEFKAFARGMVDGCKKVAEAAETGSFDNYQLGFSQMNQGCTKCHGTYR